LDTCPPAPAYGEFSNRQIAASLSESDIWRPKHSVDIAYAPDRTRTVIRTADAATQIRLDCLERKGRTWMFVPLHEDRYPHDHSLVSAVYLLVELTHPPVRKLPGQGQRWRFSGRPPGCCHRARSQRPVPENSVPV